LPRCERGAGRIIIVDGVPERLEVASMFGADDFLDLREFTSPQTRVKRVREMTDGWGVDVVMEVAISDQG
jgi:threonine dehydrogenase-like Zn-dependent dehydrogenase